jgi:hypothetical protein
MHLNRLRIAKKTDCLRRQDYPAQNAVKNAQCHCTLPLVRKKAQLDSTQITSKKTFSNDTFMTKKLDVPLFTRRSRSLIGQELIKVYQVNFLANAAKSGQGRKEKVVSASLRQIIYDALILINNYGPHHHTEFRSTSEFG